jgi:hypothetical protein
MARFSQAFLQGLLQPTYQQGLFEAAKGLGQTPAILDLQREEEKRTNIQTQAQQALLNKDYATLRTLLPQMQPKEAAPFVTQIQAGEKEASRLEVANEVTRIQSEIRDLMSDDTIPADTKDIRRAALEKELLEAAKGLSFAEQQQVESFSADLEQSLIVQKRAEEAAEIERKRFDEWLEDSDIRDINRELAVARYEDYLDDDVIRQANREKATLIALNQSAKAAYVAGGEEAKEAWLANNPGQEAVWEDILDQKIVDDARIAQAKDTLKSSEFNYTDEQLLEFGLSQNDINTIKSIPSNTAKNAALLKVIIANAEAGQLPSAQMATLFSKAAEQRVMEENDLNPRNEKDLAQIKSLAAQLGLKAAQQAQKSGKVEDGFRFLASYQEGTDILNMGVSAVDTGEETESEDSMSAFIREQEAR